MNWLFENIERIPFSGCWIWMGAINGNGYATIYIKGIKERMGHRVSWIIANGSIPKRKVIMHRCDVRCCVNPDHLMLGTHSDNSKDMVAKGKHRGGPRNRTHCPQGHLYDAKNTYGRRICRTCCREAGLRWYYKHKDD